MAELHFVKMHGCGNDYIYFDGTKERIADPEAAAVRLSDRHFGIGGDGIIIIGPSDKADFEMAMYNADGSRGKMCGNGIRCVGKYVYDRGLTGKKHLKIETLSGIRELELITDDDGKVSKVRVDMGRPILDLPDIPVDEELWNIRSSGEGLDIAGGRYSVTPVSMGNPHAVVFQDKDEWEPERFFREFPISVTGPLFENDPLFPERINAEFVIPVNDHELYMRVWERGSGETFACGTGACASVVASVLAGKISGKATVHLLGGDLEIEWDRDDGHVYMTGPAETVFEGTVEL